MKNLKSMLKNIAVYTGLISTLAFGAYACGPEEPTQNPNGDEIVSVDSGNSNQDGGLEDVINTPDANGADVNLTDVQYTDVEIVDTLDGGYDACVGCDTDSTDTYVHPDGGDVDLTDTYDGGQDVGGDAGQVKAVLKYLIEKYSDNPIDYQYEPRTIDINLHNEIFYSACDSTGEGIAGYKLTDDKGLDQIIPKSDCLIGSVQYNNQKGVYNTKLQSLDINSQPIGIEDTLIINVK